MMNMIFGRNEWGNYIRINKTEARKLHAQGEDIYMVPCKMSPINCWGLCYRTNKNNWGDSDYNFDQIVNLFEGYNCNNETGRYAAYYKIG